MLIKPPSPRWDCRDEKDIEHFEAWTNAQLDELEKLEELAYDPRRDPFHIFHPTAALLEQDNAQRLKRGRVILAVEAGDHETFARLADTPELRRLAFKRHKRGRETGDSRPRDIPQLTKWCCEEALADVVHIRRIWKQTYGLRNRAMSPTAMEIAARRHNIDPEVLIDFKKNWSRNQRRRS
jgi:hypothetical protein